MDSIQKCRALKTQKCLQDCRATVGCGLFLQMMQRIITPWLLVLYISTATEFVQFAKLPMLIVHYIEHAEEGNCSLWEFFHEHYMQGDVHDSDRARDLQLPFKVGVAGAWLIVGDTTTAGTFPILLLAHMLVVRYSPSADPLLGIPASIWHPPACS